MILGSPPWSLCSGLGPCKDSQILGAESYASSGSGSKALGVPWPPWNIWNITISNTLRLLEKENCADHL